MEEAEAATAQLDAAFKATGATLGLTRTRLDTLATSLQQTTKFSDDLVKEGESILLTFTKVRGEAFERTIKVATELSSRLGTDLKTAIRQVGLALQDPVAGLVLLRRAGISFDDAQKSLIKGFIETNQLGKAQNLILGELENRFKGSAAAARNTLGGALAGLKNAFSDLFEGSRESGKAAAEAINEITKALSDPKTKAGMDLLIEGSAKIAANFIKAAAAQASAFKEGLALGDYNNYSRGSPNPRRRAGRSAAADPDGPATAVIEEINVKVRKLVDENGDLLREMRNDTRTEVQQIAAEYTKLKTTLQFLRDEGPGKGGISGDEYQKRLGAALDDLLPEFDLNKIKAMHQSLKAATTEVGEFIKGVWQGVGRSIQSTVSDAIYEWRLSWRSLIDIARRALSDITSAIITSGISKALKSQFGGSSGASTSELLADSFFAYLGAGKAGGGRFDGLTMVGEDGPELVTGSGKVWNQRQLAFGGMGGGGGGVTYAPVNNFNIIERENPDQTKREMIQYFETRSAQQQQEFVRRLGRNGVGVK